MPSKPSAAAPAACQLQANRLRLSLAASGNCKSSRSWVCSACACRWRRASRATRPQWTGTGAGYPGRNPRLTGASCPPPRSVRSPHHRPSKAGRLSSGHSRCRTRPPSRGGALVNGPVRLIANGRDTLGPGGPTGGRAYFSRIMSALLCAFVACWELRALPTRHRPTRVSGGRVRAAPAV